KHGERLARGARALQDYSERAMRAILERAPSGRWAFEDVMDGDGHDAVDVPIVCALELRSGEAHLDFTGTAAQVVGPINVPRAVTVSAAMYAFRCLAPASLPPNAGSMRPIHVRTQPGTLVDAVYPAPVAAGNVETSQRITDVVLGALAKAMPDRIPAASAGSMNNVLIGGEDGRAEPARAFTYYETIGGGSGALKGAGGAHAVQTHMTNTLNTPIEALEQAYPFRVERYAVRRGSGGQGLARGGDGAVREYAFTSDATVTLMTERRRHAPWGAGGGSPGARGRNILVRDGVERELAGKVTFEVRAGDRVRVETPGGGGWGDQKEM
ncbi:MAG: hydantoinase B/oxoprolinase family protein, partial [Myxococcota bacterium]